MTTQEPPRVPGPAPVPLRCPRCGAGVAPEQDWCLECGAPARTRLAPTPNWRAPVALVAVVVLLAGVALAFAFTNLTSNDGHVAATAATTTAPAQPNDTAPQTTVPTAPAATSTSAASAAIPGSGG